MTSRNTHQLNISYNKLKRSQRDSNTENLYFLLQLYAIYKAEAVYKKLPALPVNDPRKKIPMAYQPVRQKAQSWKLDSIFNFFSLRKVFSRLSSSFNL